MARSLVLPLALIQSSPHLPTNIYQQANMLLSRLEDEIELSQGQFAATVHYKSRLAGEWSSYKNDKTKDVTSATPT
ncbi:unnamed protein product [Fusarium fujikuroi]|uniref:Uncharacterized protein n=1 Tax=Fusarium fujikuroi TaxID=5127 RepID=A0A9Q9UH52_FUSFU|nr:unnamed protein product [Fusarium fujikuroi]VZI07049.1 unnamed protein product [Fusarium fujikuroi]